MKQKRPAGQPRGEVRRSVDRDGVVRIELAGSGRSPWIWLAGLAAAGALVGLALWLWLRPTSEAAGGGHQGGPAAQARATSKGGARSRRRAAPGAAARPGEAADPTRPGESGGDRGLTGDPSSPEDPDAPAPDEPGRAPERRAGIPGLPPHGSKQIKPGIVVPEDFPLPPGYVRHYQTTDKGRQLEAVLMFHPDYQPVDAQGNPVPVPEDRLVPPELAPPGLPLNYLEVPEDAYSRPEDDEAPPGEGEIGEPDPEEGEADPAP